MPILNLIDVIMLIVVGATIFTGYFFISGVMLIILSVRIATISTKHENNFINAPLITHSKNYKKLVNISFIGSLIAGIGLIIFSIFG